VAATAPGAGTPTGTVTFMNGASAIGAPVALSAGTAILMTTLPPGVLSITAIYSGDVDFLTSTSAAQSVTITTSTTTTLTSAPNPSTYGQSVTLTATITPTPTGASLGTVNFFNGATNIGTGSVNASGVATLSVTTLPVGSLTLTANYSGNTAFGTSTSAPITQTVNVAPTTTTLAASPSPATFGQSVTLTATVTPAPTGTSLGTVTFANGGTTLGTATPNSSGVATFSTTSLPAGNLTLTAAYSGNVSFGASTSAGVALTVNTTFAIMISQASFQVGQGGSVMIPVDIPPQGGPFNNAVVMSATGLPPGSTGAFVPPSVTPGATTGTTVLTVQLAPLAAEVRPPGPSRGAPLPAFTLAVGLLLFVRRKHLRAALQRTAAVVACTLLAASLIGCSGGFLRPPSTPPGNFTVTITGTSGAITQSATVTVVVR